MVDQQRSDHFTTTDTANDMRYQIIVDELSVDPIANTSTINITVEAWRFANNANVCSRPGMVTVKINDWYVTSQEWANNEKSIYYMSDTQVFEVSLDITHEADGSSQIYVYASMVIWNPYTGEPYIESDPEEQGFWVTLSKLPGLLSLNITDVGMDYIDATVQSPGQVFDKWWYTIDNGNTWVEFSNTADTSQSVRIENLSLNTTYHVGGRARVQGTEQIVTTPIQTVKTKNLIIQSATRITIFSEGASDFTTNGLGSLPDTTSCIVTEEKNGAYELELKYPITGLNYEEIRYNRIILAKPNQYSQSQPFRIYAISRPLNGIVTVNAAHLSYDLSGITVGAFSAGSLQTAFQNLKSRSDVVCPFDFYTDISTPGAISTHVPVSIRSLLGGNSGSILETFGGEFEFDIYTVRLLTSRGQDRGVTIRYGKNLTDIKQDENCNNVYTAVRPYWFKTINNYDVLVELPEKIVSTPGIFTYIKVLPVDFTSTFDEIFEGEDRENNQPTVAELRAITQYYIEENNIGVPDVSLNVSFVQLTDSKEYADLKLLEGVQLCDYVSVYFPQLGINAKAQCVKTVYNVLTQRYNSILLGTVRNDLASTIANQGQSIKGGVTKTELNRAINGTSSSIGVEVAGVLQAGSTTLTIQNGLINTSSTIDVYTDKFGLCPKNIVVSDKQVVLTFDAQSSNTSVKIRIA
ncbi:MAG: phage tail protein [Pseudobutyrivibrio sp.]|nr:phage tail protein [Pseudobutyrivibrio sp.]